MAARSPWQAGLLGEYHFGLFFSTTVFERFSSADLGVPPGAAHRHAAQYPTSQHEIFHSVQDCATGFGCLVAGLMTASDEAIIGRVRDAVARGSRLEFPWLRHHRERQAHEALTECAIVQHVIAQLCEGSSNAMGLSALDVLEGAAAVYTELCRNRFLLIQGGPAGQGVDGLDAMSERLHAMPAKYSRAFDYFRSRVPRHPDATDAEVYDLFLAVCDLALHVPPPASGMVDLRGQLDANVRPGDRFVAIVRRVASLAGSTHLRVPEGGEELASMFDGTVFKSRESRGDLEAHPRPAGAVEFDRFIEAACADLGGPSFDAVCDAWIERLEAQTQAARDEHLLKLRLLSLRTRRRAPYACSSFANLRHVATMYPSFCRTRWGPMMQVGCDMEGAIWLQRTITAKLFLRTVAQQIVETGIGSCPYVDRTMYDCDAERAECADAIGLEDPRFDQCLFGRYWEGFAGVKLARVSSARLEDHAAARLWFEVARAHDSAGRRFEALACYDRATRLDPALVTAWNNQGTVLNELSRNREAIACYDRALEGDPGYAAAWFNKGNALQSLGDDRDALGCYLRAEALEPSQTGYRLNRAILQWRLSSPLAPAYHDWLVTHAGAVGPAPGGVDGRTDEALLRFYRRAVEREPENPDAWFGMGVAWLHVHDDRERAVGCFEEAANLGHSDGPLVAAAIRHLPRP